MNKRGQVTIFVIIAVVIVVAIIGYFVLIDRISVSSVPEEFQPAYNYYISCVEEEVEAASMLAGERGGYLFLPEFEPGSAYKPYSSQLDFFGQGVPYWYYLSGNNLIKEQVPSKSLIQEQFNEYLVDKIEDCGFGDYEKNMIIEKGEASVSTKIQDSKISVDFSIPISFASLESSARVSKHEVEVDSKLGRFYKLAIDIYNKEKQEAFLERYSEDVLRLYAPVDGVEMTCAPKVWYKQEIDETLKKAFEANMGAIRLEGNKGYFVQDMNIQEDVRFLYDRNWPTRIEIYDTGDVLIAEPVGLQQGLGVLGFCYVPYHYVYDIDYPVLVQIYDEAELFQFPFSVVIDKNLPRESLDATVYEDAEPELCKYQNTEIDVYTYNSELEPVEARIDFRCLQQTCKIGETEIHGGDAALTEKFPQCVNGFIIARAEGYADATKIVSTIDSGQVDIILDPLYNVSIDFMINTQPTSDYAIISFVSDRHSRTVAWPEQRSVELAEGLYNISVFAYNDGSVSIPAMKKEQCSDVPKSGIGGILGATEEKCFDINIPAQTLQNIISAGGDTQEYLTEMQLEQGTIEINTPSIPIPKSLEELQDSYIAIENNPLYIDFK